jgi:hypothetical protein
MDEARSVAVEGTGCVKTLSNRYSTSLPAGTRALPDWATGAQR